ncbi:hypothetical protein D3C81_1969580 [compost metagenome]
MPEDAVEISEEVYRDVIANPMPEKVRSHDAGGYPFMIDAPPAKPPTYGELAAFERTWRDSKFAATEWLVNRHRDEQDMQQSRTLTAEQFAALLVYRQMLRDWPQDSRFPYCAFRPVEPSWLAEQVQ